MRTTATPRRRIRGHPILYTQQCRPMQRPEYMAMPLDAGAGADMGGAREFGGLDSERLFQISTHAVA